MRCLFGSLPRASHRLVVFLVLSLTACGTQSIDVGSGAADPVKDAVQLDRVQLRSKTDGRKIRFRKDRRDTTAPVLSEIAVSTTETSAVITWNTDELATSYVDYAPSTDYGASTASQGPTLQHEAVIADLSPATLYHFLITVQDASGNLATSDDQTFATQSMPTEQPPAQDPAAQDPTTTDPPTTDPPTTDPTATDPSTTDPSTTDPTTTDPSTTDPTARCVPRSSGFVTDRGAFVLPALPVLPPAGGTFTDPTFGTRIMRLTDESNGSDNQVAYSYWPTFNLDSTRAIISTSVGITLFTFNPVDHAILEQTTLPAPPSGSLVFEGAIWSSTDPNVLFAHTLGGRLYAFHAGTRTYSLVKDFNPALPGEYQWQMTKSADDNTFAFTRRSSSSYAVLGYVVYQRKTDTVRSFPSQYGIDEVHIDKSGEFVMVATGSQGAGAIEGQVRDLVLDTVVDLTDDAPDYNPMHYALGTGTIAGDDNWQNRITARSLASPHDFTVLLDLGSDWSLGMHSSMGADDESWLLVSFYGGTPPGLFRGEVVQVATDGSGAIRRLAHHRSISSDYYDMPRANISSDGCYVAFTSNWGGSGRRDVFILDLSQ